MTNVQQSPEIQSSPDIDVHAQLCMRGLAQMGQTLRTSVPVIDEDTVRKDIRRVSRNLAGISQELATAEPSRIGDYVSLSLNLHHQTERFYEANPNIQLPIPPNNDYHLALASVLVGYRSTPASTSADKLRTAFKAEPTDGGIHSLVTEIISQEPGPRTYFRSKKRLVETLYDTSSTVELLGALNKDDVFEAQIRTFLLKPDTLDATKYEEVAIPPKSTVAEQKKLYSEFYSSILQSMYPDIDTEFANAIGYTASNDRDRDDKYSATSLFSNTIAMFDRFGIEKLSDLHKACGTTMFGAHTVDQLELMHKVFVEEDQPAIEKLQAQDVRVVMIDKLGDENGVLSQVPDQYDIDKTPALFFEVAGF